MCFRLDRTGNAVKIKGFQRARHSACIESVLGKIEAAIERVTGKPLYTALRCPHWKPKVKMVYRGMISHLLRHTGVCNLLHAGVPERVVHGDTWSQDTFSFRTPQYRLAGRRSRGRPETSNFLRSEVWVHFGDRGLRDVFLQRTEQLIY